MTRRRTTRRVAGAAMSSGVALVLLATPAWAHHAEVVAAANCTGTVTYSVTAWAGVPNTPANSRANEQSRTNPDVAVEISEGGGPFRRVVDHLKLTPSNFYATAGTFALPAGPLPRRLVVRAVTVAPFANGSLGSARSAPELDLSRCHGQRSAAAGTSPGSGAPHRTEFVLGGGLLGSLGAWRLTRPRRGGA